MFQLLIGVALLSICQAQQQQKYTTPVPILKQINRHNEDGSYSYGYEGADGAFKIETKYPTGEVYGKYGYVDDSGKVREVEYGASRRGFEPAGNDINVAPPTLNQNQNAVAPLAPNEEDDGQYREDPSVYYKNDVYNQPKTQTTYQQPQQQPAYQQPQQQPTYQQPQTYRPQQNYNIDTFLNSDFFRSFNTPAKINNTPRYTPPVQNYNPPVQNYNPVQRYDPPAPRYNNPAPTYNNYNPGYNNWAGHPAQNLDISSGSYTVNY